MRRIIDGKLYDTEKARLLFDYKTRVYHNSNSIMGSYMTRPFHYASIYKTKKGTYLKYIGNACETAILYENYEQLEVISEEEVKQLLLRINDVDNYIKIFGKLEKG